MLMLFCCYSWRAPQYFEVLEKGSYARRKQIEVQELMLELRFWLRDRAAPHSSRVR
jgi:hypothetical protein